MPDINLTEITAARARVDVQQDELRQARLELAAAALRRDTANSRGDTATVTTATTDAEALGTKLAGLISGVRDGIKAVRDRSDAALVGIRPEGAVASLSGEIPVLLLPVRLETRFFDAGKTLRVRIFPDQAHVTAHDPALTADEIDGLTWYWTQRWPAPDAAGAAGRALAVTAWQGLTARFRPGRAAFLVRAYPPVNVGSGDPEPRWSDLPKRAGEWSVAARAGLLPDRWCVIGFRRDAEGRHTEIFRVWGAAVPDTLAAGPTPDPGPAAEPGGLPDDPDLRWVHDAQEAARLGMLVTITQSDLVAGASLRDGVDRLVALGVDWTLTPEQAAAAVADHLRAHADEGRLAFVPQGVPTNSTGTTRSAFTTDLTAAQRVLAPHETPDATADAAAPLTAAALGLDPAVLRDVAGADLREQAWQGALLDATWSATGGYYLTEMLDPVAADPHIEASMREHVAAHLRASGPLPTLRIGAQPYGILPVTPRDRFEPDVRRRAQADVARVTGALRSLVEPLVADVPRLAQVRRREDVDDVLLKLLQRTPVAWSLTFRNLVGPVERKAMSVNWELAAAFQRNVTAVLLAQLECFQLTLLSELTHDEHDHPLDVPLVRKPDPTPEDPSRTSTGYLGEIASLLVETHGIGILTARTNSVALLEALLAWAAVQDAHRAAKHLVAGKGETLQLSSEFTAYLNQPADRAPYTLRVESPPTARAAAGVAIAVPSTPREFATTILPGLTGDRTVGQFVLEQYREQLVIPGVLDVPENPLHRLHRMGSALETLQAAPPDQLEWAFRGVLDLYATRLDAWITSLATARLAEHRASSASGIHVGGWGIVEDLRPDSGAAAESLGFVHAPSLAQAASVAVLRSARLSHRDAQGRLFDLDLTSKRVRQALHVLEGMGAGQRLAALLGYRFERSLQERDLLLAQWILPLRQQCPLDSARPDNPQAIEPVEVVAARDVVDGLALLARWEADRDGLLAAAGVPAGVARKGVAAVLDEVAGLADAVSDVLTAEAVHQATAGNLERSGAALAAHDRQGPAPDPAFVRTPRDGAVLTHRVGVWLPRTATSAAPGWPGDLRSLAEPRLDRWLGAVLGDPARWSVGATLVRPPLAPDAGPTLVPLAEVTVADLGLSALSVVLAARRPGSGQPSELESRVAARYASSAQVQALAPTPEDRLDLDAGGLAVLLDVAAWAAEVVGAAPLAAEHLASAADVGVAAVAATTDVSEAVARADAVQAAVSGLANAADAALAAYQSAQAVGTESALVATLVDLVEVEGPDALPAGADVSLDIHAAQVVARVRARLAAAAELVVPAAAVVAPGDLPTPGVAEDGRLVRARGVVRLLLGNGQPFLPVLDPVDPTVLSAALAGRDGLLAGDPTAAVTWLHRSALVRPQLDPFAALLVHAEADGAAVPEELAVLQTPYALDIPWAALPFGPHGPPPAGTVALVLHAPDALDPLMGGAGLLIDSWTETVPATQDTTAVTFHYDAPGARAPQTMLLAVHPAKSPQRWDFDTLLGCVHEAMDLARLRTLGAGELAPFTTFLPGLFLPDTYTRDVPGVRFTELAANAHVLAVGGLISDHVLGKAGHA